MTDDEQIERKIAENYRLHPWAGIVPIEKAIAGSVEYRRGLSMEDRALYDRAIMEGWVPWNAAEMVEFASGRTDRSRRSHAASISKAS